jgi:glucokinase
MTGLALVADIGGTHCRLALARPGDAAPALEAVQVVPTPHGRLGPTFAAYLGALGGPPVDRCAVAAAGRVVRDGGGARVLLTNTGLAVHTDDLRAHASARAPVLVNDLAAAAAALPVLAAGDLQPLDAVAARAEGTRLALGIGTGVGAAVRLAGGALLDTEAGHVELAAVTARERACLAGLPGGRASAESLFAGPGLPRLHALLPGGDAAPEATAAGLVARANAGDAAALATFALYSTWLGRYAGDLVLAYGAWGGLYLLGGVVAGLGDLLDARAFRAGMVDKLQFGDELAAVPVQRVLHPQPALLGLATLVFA